MIYSNKNRIENKYEGKILRNIAKLENEKKRKIFRNCQYCDSLILLEHYQIHLNKFHKKTITSNTNTEEREIKKIYLFWEDISFGNDCIKFNISRTKTIIRPLPYQGVNESLNQIKSEYFKRIYSKDHFKLWIYRNEVLLNKSKDLKKIFEQIEIFKGKRAVHGNNTINNRNKTTDHSSLEILVNKNQYTKFLGSLQDTSFKMKPIWEFISNQFEEALLFRFKTKTEKILLVWENINTKRASHIFLYSDAKQETILKEIEKYIYTNNTLGKRQLLYLNTTKATQTKQKLAYYCHLMHTNLSDYKKEIIRFIKSN